VREALQAKKFPMFGSTNASQQSFRRDVVRVGIDVLALNGNNGGAGRLASITSEQGLRIARRLALAVWAVTFVTLPLFLVGMRHNDMLDLHVYRTRGLAWLNGIRCTTASRAHCPGRGCRSPIPRCRRCCSARSPRCRTG